MVLNHLSTCPDKISHITHHGSHGRPPYTQHKRKGAKQRDRDRACAIVNRASMSRDKKPQADKSAASDDRSSTVPVGLAAVSAAADLPPEALPHGQPQLSPHPPTPEQQQHESDLSSFYFHSPKPARLHLVSTNLLSLASPLMSNYHPVSPTSLLITHLHPLMLLQKLYKHNIGQPSYQEQSIPPPPTSSRVISPGRLVRL